ncbi:hypothetical protein WK68_34615 [Burkholderia ubonensis]|nr:hypothetical protein WK68_34615 [Burkholderia ubonensis]
MHHAAVRSCFVTVALDVAQHFQHVPFCYVASDFIEMFMCGLGLLVARKAQAGAVQPAGDDGCSALLGFPANLAQPTILEMFGRVEVFKEGG